MRVLFVPMTTTSHYSPMVPIAWACRAAGHEVRVAGQPALVDVIRQSGMTGVRVGADFDMNLHMTDVQKESGGEVQQLQRQALAAGGVTNLPQALQRRVLELRFGPTAGITEAVAEDLVSLARSWRPHVVVGDPLLPYAAPLAAAACGASLVRHLWGPDLATHVGVFPGIGTTGRGDDRDDWPDSLLRIFDRYQVDVRENFYDLALDPGPTSLQVPGVKDCVPYGCLPYNGAGVLPDWLLKEPSVPRICMTQGTVRSDVLGNADAFLPKVIAGLADFDVEIVVAVKSEDRGLFENAPGNVRIAEWVPLNLILPTCSAVVHQGGAGSTLTSAFCGVPQLIIPQILDEIFEADRFSSCGAAVKLDPTRITDSGQFSDISARIIGEFLTDGNAVTQAARGLQKELAAQPVPAEIVPRLENLVA